MSVPPLCRYQLSANTVQVWKASLSEFAPYLAYCRTLLSPDESRRAARYAFERDASRFVLSHGLMRVLLAQYLSISPVDIVYQYGAHGKPALSGVHSGADVRFSVSHSADCLLCAFSVAREIGVDVELVRSNIEHGALAQRFFSTREYDDIRSCPEGRQGERFYRYWTCKEAYLKARGLGLSSGLSHVEIAFDQQETLARLIGKPLPADEVDWKIQSLTVGTGMAAAVAGEGHNWESELAVMPEDVLP